MATTDLGKWMITNGGEYDPGVTYEKLTMVMYNNSTYITLQTVNGVEPTNDGVNYTLMAQGFSANALSDVVAQDTNGALGTAGQEVSAQSLVDWMTDQVMNQVLKKVDLVNNALATIPGQAALDSAMGKNFQNQIDGINSNLGTMTFRCDRTSKNFGTLVLNSEREDPDSKEGSQIAMYGKGGNAGTVFSIDCFDNVLRIFYTINEQLIVYNFKPDGIYINNERINSFTQAIYSGDIYQLAPGAYYCTPSVLNLPKDNIYFFVEIFNWENGKEKIIRATSTNEPNARHVYTNFFSGGNWQGWLMLA